MVNHSIVVEGNVSCIVRRKIVNILSVIVAGASIIVGLSASGIVLVRKNYFRESKVSFEGNGIGVSIKIELYHIIGKSILQNVQPRN